MNIEDKAYFAENKNYEALKQALAQLNYDVSNVTKYDQENEMFLVNGVWYYYKTTPLGTYKINSVRRSTYSKPVEDKRYFAISPAETQKKIRDLTAAWRKLMNVADNLHGMANPSPEIMKRQDQVDADMERVAEEIAALKKSIGVQENVSVRLSKPVEDKAYFDRQGSKAKFAATRIWPNDYGEINNANAKYARLIFDRQKIIRANAGRRIKGEQPLEVPALPTAPEFPFAFADGDYVGLVLGGQANVPKGATVKWAHNANSIKMSRTGTKTKFANRGAFAEASSSPVLGSLLEKKVMPEGGWRAVETDGGALVIAFEDGDIAGNFARRASENGYSATAPMAMAGRFWNVKVQNENKQ